MRWSVVRLDRSTRAILASSMVARVATLSPEGAPLLTPLWFVAMSGKLWFVTHRPSLVVRNLEALSRVSLLFEENIAQLPRLLRITGQATVHQRGPSASHLLRLAFKYHLSPRAVWHEVRHVDRWRLRSALHSQGSPVVVEVAPERTELLGAT